MTGTNALVGMLVGAVGGVAAALVASRFRLASEMLTPLAAAVNAMPIIALAPIFNNMFSTTSAMPRRLVVAVVVFFPVFVNTLRGLVQVDATQVRADAHLRGQRLGRRCGRCASRTPCRSSSPG